MASANLTKKRQLWTQEDMEKALAACQETNALARQVAKKFNIPPTTLHSYLNEKYSSSKMGRKTELTEEEENALKFYIEYM